MRIEIEHRLTLSTPPGVAQAVLHLLLTPGSGPTQRVESWSVEAAGIGNSGRFADAFGNLVHLVNQPRPEGDIVVVARGVVSTRDSNGVLGRPAGEPVPALYRRLTELTSAPEGAVDQFAAGSTGRLDLLHGLMGWAHAAPAQATQMQADGAQSQAQGGEGDPIDRVHRFIGTARALGIPARFVTGYLAGEDSGEGGLHFWAEAFDEALGWIGFDPTLNLCPTERHVRLAVGLDAESAMPMRAVPAGELVQSADVTAVQS